MRTSMVEHFGVPARTQRGPLEQRPGHQRPKISHFHDPAGSVVKNVLPKFARDRLKSGEKTIFLDTPPAEMLS
jgi:hypothetical protein